MLHEIEISKDDICMIGLPAPLENGRVEGVFCNPLYGYYGQGSVDLIYEKRTKDEYIDLWLTVDLEDECVDGSLSSKYNVSSAGKGDVQCGSSVSYELVHGTMRKNVSVSAFEYSFDARSMTLIVTSPVHEIKVIVKLPQEARCYFESCCAPDSKRARLS